MVRPYLKIKGKKRTRNTVGSMIEGLHSMCEVLGSSLSTIKKKKIRLYNEN